MFRHAKNSIFMNLLKNALFMHYFVDFEFTRCASPVSWIQIGRSQLHFRINSRMLVIEVRVMGNHSDVDD